MAPKRKAIAAKASKATTTKAASTKRADAAKPSSSRRPASRTSKRKDEVARPSKEQKAPEEQLPAKRRRRAPEEVELQPVTHASHGRVPAQLFVWGGGHCGQLGLGEEVIEKYRPYPLDLDGQQVLQVACGGMHSAAIAADGRVFTWGVNDEGALGRQTPGQLWETSPLAKGDPGDSWVPGVVGMPPGARRIVQVSAGDSHTCALDEVGAVYAWGTFRDAGGVYGFAPGVRVQLVAAEVYRPTKPADQVVQIASGAKHVLALTSGGTVLSWGTSQHGQLGRVGHRLRVRDQEATLLRPHPLLLRRRRNVTGHPTAVSCGEHMSYVLTTGGQVLACGLNQFGQLALSDLEPVWEPHHVQQLDGAQEVKGGQHHALSLQKDGECAGQLLAFGCSTYGRLGRNDVNSQSADAVTEAKPVVIPNGVTVKSVATGLAVSGCVDGDGCAWLWGFGTDYQLAKGDSVEDTLVPRKVVDSKFFKNRRVLALNLGGQHGALLAVDRAEGEHHAAEGSGAATAAASKGKGKAKAGEGGSGAASAAKGKGKAKAGEEKEEEDERPEGEGEQAEEEEGQQEEEGGAEAGGQEAAGEEEEMEEAEEADDGPGGAAE